MSPTSNRFEGEPPSGWLTASQAGVKFKVSRGFAYNVLYVYRKEARFYWTVEGGKSAWRLHFPPQGVNLVKQRAKLLHQGPPQDKFTVYEGAKRAGLSHSTMTKYIKPYVKHAHMHYARNRRFLPHYTLDVFEKAAADYWQQHGK